MNLEKQRARGKVREAVRKGLLVRPETCSECGNVHPNIQAHHHDYSKSLEVQWLCSKCHARIHRGDARAYKLTHPAVTTGINTVQRGLRVPRLMDDWIVEKVTRGNYRTPQEVILEAIREKQQAEQAAAA